MSRLTPILAIIAGGPLFIFVGGAASSGGTIMLCSGMLALTLVALFVGTLAAE